MEKKLKQRRSGKLLGGVTGKGFLPGKTGNPNGRPRTRGLVNALRASVSDISPDGRSIEELLVAALIEEAFGGRNRMAALAYIFDRLEGRPSQQIEVADITRDAVRLSWPRRRIWAALAHQYRRASQLLVQTNPCSAVLSLRAIVAREGPRRIGRAENDAAAGRTEAAH